LHRACVAVHQTGGVRDLQRPPGLPSMSSVCRQRRAGPFEQELSGSPFDQFHHQIGGAPLRPPSGLAIVDEKLAMTGW